MMSMGNLSAMKISLLVGIWSTLLSIIPALAFAWILVHRNFPGKMFLNMLLFFPLVSPPVVTGFLLLKFLGRNSFIGEFLGLMGIHIPFSILGAIIAAMVVSFPLFVMSIKSALNGIDPHLEKYAMSAGHGEFQTFLKVTLPLSLPGIMAGAIIAFARSLGEFGATVVLAGNIEDKTRTIPMAIYSLMDTPGGEKHAHELLLASLAISCLALVAHELCNRRYWKRIEWKR